MFVWRSNLKRLLQRPACVLLCLATLPAAIAATPASDPALDFNFDIRPLLSDRCFKCHGPDEDAREAGLRLDTREGATKKLSDGRFAIQPGDPDRSELIRRIESSDPNVQMPPREANLSLAPHERQRLRRWIAEGAPYESHWAYQPIQAPPVPAVNQTSWPANPLDHFVLTTLKTKGWHPANPAAKETWIRRVSLDLTGLPPTPQAIDDFLQDDSDAAWSRVVDRLLQSPAYGERMANDWLDVARYADTYGYQADVDRDMSPWRDWVIRAFNENLPYDEFIRWQLAGDLLPDPTRDQILATAFNRLHRQTNEGGSIEEEFRVEYAADRVHTMGTAFLGLTLECARCHDHKYDPITQKNYYQLFAFFNNIDESGLYSHFTRAVPNPTLLLFRDGERQKHRNLQQEIRRAEQSLIRIAQDSRSRFDEWRQQGNALPPLPNPTAQFSFDRIFNNQSPNQIDTNAPAVLHDNPQLVPGRPGAGQAIFFDGDNSAVCQNIGAFHRTDPFSVSLQIKIQQQHGRAVIFHRSRAWTDSGSRGYELLLENNRPAWNLIHFWPGNAIGIRALDPLPTNTWLHLTATYDGSSHAEGLRLYLNGEPLLTETVRDHLFKDIVHRTAWGDASVNEIHLTLAGRFRDSGFQNGLVDDFRVYDTELSAGEVRELAGTPPALLTERERYERYLRRQNPDYLEASRRLHQLRIQENDLINDVPEIMVMREMESRRPTHILARGSYTNPGLPVQPDVPDAILPFPENLPRNRLGLADWITHSQNPLTARVAVNRVWRMHFGRGLVPTLEDFGSQGQLPSHPKLLDWLAAWFIEHDWDRKALHRLIVLSSTYRQSSHATPEALSRDPQNHYLARGPSHRLPAETLRDSALAVSGLLIPKVGGPSVYPYQPPGIWQDSGTGKSYPDAAGDHLYRRSLYTFWRRTAPPPSMLAFDAPAREVCTAQRETTTTPLQALVLLNDPQYVEAARTLSQQLLGESRIPVDAMLSAAWRRILGRFPDDQELRILQRLYREQQEHFAAHPESAAAFLAVGHAPAPQSLPPPDTAALTVVVHTIMNHDAFIMKR